MIILWIVLLLIVIYIQYLSYKFDDKRIRKTIKICNEICEATKTHSEKMTKMTEDHCRELIDATINHCKELIESADEKLKEKD
jgi:hypothetical protein